MTNYFTFSRKTVIIIAVTLALIVSYAGFGAARGALQNVFAPQVAQGAAVDYFLKIDGIDGESTSRNHKGEIDVESWSWGASQPGIVGNSATGGAGGAGGAGKPAVHDLVITKMADKSSPKLMLAAATGQHIPTATLTVERPGKNPQFYTIKLSDVLVSSYQAAGDGGSVPTDTFTLNFSKIEFSVIGADGAPSTAAFNVAQNQQQ